MDQEKIKQAVRLFLEGIGEDAGREGLRETPGRVARMCEELFAGYTSDAKAHLTRTFHADTGNMVVEKNIPFYSVCEHHFLPFYGNVSIAYVPDGQVVGLIENTYLHAKWGSTNASKSRKACSRVLLMSRTSNLSASAISVSAFANRF